MTSGVPQGSVLGPILFLIYINDLPDRTRSKVWLFADDTAIYLAVSNLQDAQILLQDLDQLHEWELQWDMEFNPCKCVVINVTRAKTPVPSKYLLHGHILESVGGSKYLGMEISSNLTFNNHIQKIRALANRSLGFIKHNIRKKSPAIREMAYKALVYPLVEYSFSVWSPNTDKYIGKIEMIHRKAARWTLDNFHTQASVTEMLTQLGWRSLEQRRNDSRLCLIYMIIYGLVAIDLPPYVEHAAELPGRTHTLWFIDRYIQEQTTTNTRSTPLQSCNGAGCHPKLHYCPLLNPSRGHYAQLATQCHKCQCAVFMF